jgi:hypothetical protein
MGESLGRGPAQGDPRRLVLPHVQAIIVAIDQYAEAALGNREFFLNRPYNQGQLIQAWPQCRPAVGCHAVKENLARAYKVDREG